MAKDSLPEKRNSQLLDLVPEIADMFGVSRSEVRRRIFTRPCATCHGSGRVQKSSSFTYGEGADSIGGCNVWSESCPDCTGLGRLTR